MRHFIKEQQRISLKFVPMQYFTSVFLVVAKISSEILELLGILNCLNFSMSEPLKVICSCD